MNNDKLTNDERAAIGHWAVIITNRVNELEQRVVDIENVVNTISDEVGAATYLLKTFMESRDKGSSIQGDT